MTLQNKVVPLSRHPLAQAVALALSLGVGSVQAATITVTTGVDVFTADGNCTLREAIQAANTNLAVDACNAGAVGHDEIEFSAALGTGTITLSLSQIEIIETLTITGPAASQMISGNNNSRIFAVTEASQPLTLENLILTEGYTLMPGTSTCAASTGRGGAVCALGDVTLINSTISNSNTMGNSADGGGISVSNGTATLIDSTITGNNTMGVSASGGGLYVLGGTAMLTNSTVAGNSTTRNYADGGGISVFGDVTLSNSTLVGNSTVGNYAYGGGLSVFGGSVTLTNSTVIGNNTAGDKASGGGLAVVIATSTAMLTNSSVTNNYITGARAEGGGLYTKQGSATLSNSTVSGNSTEGLQGFGGGISVNVGDATLSNSTVSDNSTAGMQAVGGGLSVSTGDTLLTNSTVSGNSTTATNAAGGGLFAISGDATLNNSTVTKNQVISGAGGIEINGLSSTVFLTLNSTILAANSGPEDNVNTLSGVGSVTVNASFSLFGDAGSEINGPINNDNILNDVPDLAALANNGCAVPAGDPVSASCVRVHALLPSSPALEAGDNPLALTDDQRGSGFPRLLATFTDIGAFEGVVLPADQIGVYRPSASRFYLDVSGNGLWDGSSTDATYGFGIVGDEALIGDWNGDGIDAIGVYRPSSRRFYLDVNGNGLWDGAMIDQTFVFGISGDIAISGDWDGVIGDEIGLYRPSAGRFYLDFNGNGVWDGSPTDATYSFGIVGDEPLIGNWDGVIGDEIGIYRPSARRFYLDFSGNGVWDGSSTDLTSVFGISGDEPISGDWNSDGLDEIGIYRPSASRFYLDLNGDGVWSGTPTDATYGFGIVGDEAIIGKW